MQLKHSCNVIRNIVCNISLQQKKSLTIFMVPRFYFRIQNVFVDFFEDVLCKLQIFNCFFLIQILNQSFPSTFFDNILLFQRASLGIEICPISTIPYNGMTGHTGTASSICLGVDFYSLNNGNYTSFLQICCKIFYFLE